MQVTELEVVLFLCCVVMTYLYLREASLHKAATKFIMLMLENKEAREKLIDAHEKFMAGK